MEQQQGISRRSMIKGSVVAGGLVWAAPTLMTSASAHNDPNNPHNHCDVRCQNYCRVKVDPQGNVYNAGVNCQNTGTFHCADTAPPAGSTVVTCCGQGKFTVTGTSEGAGASVTITVTDTLCRLEKAFVKQANSCQEITPITNCSTATWTGASSHVEFLICCQTS